MRGNDSIGPQQHLKSKKVAQRIELRVCMDILVLQVIEGDRPSLSPGRAEQIHRSYPIAKCRGYARAGVGLAPEEIGAGEMGQITILPQRFCSIPQSPAPIIAA